MVSLESAAYAATAIAAIGTYIAGFMGSKFWQIISAVLIVAMVVMIVCSLAAQLLL